MEGRGASEATSASRARAVALWRQWCAAGMAGWADMAPALPLPVPIPEMPAAHLINRNYYGRFADWLVREYAAKDGKPLHPGTLDGYIQYLMQEAKARALTTMDEEQRRAVERFFTCSGGDGGNTEESRWFQKLKHNMRRTAVARLTAVGQPLNHSADPIYNHHVVALMSAYARHGSVDAASRKLLVRLCFILYFRTYN
jgi:hypothetical protein